MHKPVFLNLQYQMLQFANCIANSTTDMDTQPHQFLNLLYHLRTIISTQWSPKHIYPAIPPQPHCHPVFAHLAVVIDLTLHHTRLVIQTLPHCQHNVGLGSHKQIHILTPLQFGPTSPTQIPAPSFQTPSCQPQQPFQHKQCWHAGAQDNTRLTTPFLLCPTCPTS
jgi:hypothetical protein